MKQKLLLHNDANTNRRLFSPLPLLQLLLVLLVSFTPSCHALNCPESCRCPQEHNTTIDCSHSLLKALPRIHTSTDTGSDVSVVEVLDLSHNALGPIINASLPRLSRLRDLDLSYNGLTRLLGCTLQGMLGLRRLSLRGNRLTSVPESLLEDAAGLEQLDLSHNLLVAVPDHVFRRVPRLKTLDLSHNLMGELVFGLAWQVPRYLTMIDLSNNHFEAVTFNSFYEARNWEPGFKRTLNLADCRLSTIEPLSLKHIPGLNDLDLSRNPSLPQQNLTAVVKELETKGLERLSIAGLNLTSLEPFFSQVTRLSLKFLNASANAIDQIPANTFTTISSLKTVDLSRNKLTALGEGFSPLRQLKTLNLSSNALTSFTGDAVSNLASLENLDVSKNSLANKADVTFAPLTNLVSLDVSDNLMTDLVLPTSTANLQRCDYHSNGIRKFTGFSSVPKLEYFDISDNDLEKVEKFLFKEAHLLKVVNFSRNSIVRLDHQAFMPQSAIVIDLSNNFLTSVQYSHWMATEELYLQRNKISDLDIQAFLRMDSLRVLDLSENKVSYLHDDLFDFTNNLRYLNLSHNAIGQAYFHFLFRNLMNLQVLDLGHNNISQMNKSMLLPLPSLQSFSIASNQLQVVKPRVFRDLQHIHDIDLSNNPFLCDCDNLGFQDWLKRTHISIVGLFSPNSSAYHCQGPEYRTGSHVTEWSPDQFECDKTMLYMIISGSVALTLIVAGVVTTILYRVYRCHKRRKTMREKSRLEDFYSNELNGKSGKGGKLDLSRMTTEEIAEEITNAIERRERRSMRKAEELARKKNTNGYVAWPDASNDTKHQKNGETGDDRNNKDKEEKKDKEKERIKGRQYERIMQGKEAAEKETKDKKNKKEKEASDKREESGYRMSKEEERALKVHRPIPVKVSPTGDAQWKQRSGRGYAYMEPGQDYGYQTEPAASHPHGRHDPRYRWDPAPADLRDRGYYARGWVVPPGHGPRRSRSQGRVRDREERYMTLPIREQDYPFRERGRSHRRGEPRMYLDHYTNEVRFGVEDLRRYPSPPPEDRGRRAARSGPRWAGGGGGPHHHQQRARSFHHLPQDHTRAPYHDSDEPPMQQPRPNGSPDRHLHGYRSSDDDRRPLIGQRAASQPYLTGETASDWL